MEGEARMEGVVAFILLLPLIRCGKLSINLAAAKTKLPGVMG